MATPAPPLEPRWCVVANVRPEPYGRATSPGTRHFVAGAKIYCADWMWGMGVETVVAIGRHRGGPNLIELLMQTRLLTNFRAKLVYRPAVLAKLAGSHHAFGMWTQERCEGLATNLNRWFVPTTALAERKETFAIALQLMREHPDGIALRDRALETIDTSEGAMTVFVLCDFLEQHGAMLLYDDVMTTLRRQRDNP